MPLDKNDPHGNGCTNCGALTEYTAMGTTSNAPATIVYGAGTTQGIVYQDTVTLGGALPVVSKNKLESRLADLTCS